MKLKNNRLSKTSGASGASGKSEECGEFGWNGIRFELPGVQTAVTVTPLGLRHLCVENDLRPCFELRWFANEQKSQTGSDKLSAELLGQLQDTLNQQSTQSCGEQRKDDFAPEKIAANFVERHFLHGTDGLLNGGLLRCTHCGTCIIFHRTGNPSRHTSRNDALLSRALQSLQCDCEGSDILWKLEKLHLHTPEAFLLKSFRFVAGLRSLDFSTPSGNLTCFRIETVRESARWMELLAEQSAQLPDIRELKKLLAETLIGIEEIPGGCSVTLATPGTIILKRQPRLPVKAARLWGSLRRRPMYFHAKLCYTLPKTATPEHVPEPEHPAERHATPDITTLQAIVIRSFVPIESDPALYVFAEKFPTTAQETRNR